MLDYLAANADRNRNSQDQYATFLTTNIVPQFDYKKVGGDPWSDLETYLRNFVNRTQNPKELYITAGRDGKASDENGDPIRLTSGNGQYEISVPDKVWKVVLVLNPGQGLADITKNTLAFGVRIANDASAIGRDWTDDVVSIDDLEESTKYDFFSSVPTDIQSKIEERSRNEILQRLAAIASGRSTASLLAYPESELSISETGIFQNAPRREGSIPNQVITSIVIPSRDNSLQISVDQNSPLDQSFRQVGVNQLSLGQVGISQIGSTQIDMSHIGVTQSSTSQVGSRGNGIRQTSTSQVSTSQISTTQIGVAQVSATKISTSQVNLSQVSTTKRYPFGVVGGIQIDSSKISFPSSITLQQFLSSHNFNLLSITTPTWTEFLQGTTPFNLNLEIKDLPTGQLADTTITEFERQGTPIAGTLTLDVDGNGLGWYLDPNPEDNSEYSQSLTSTAFRATPGSAAYGHYDLLTTILHELGHLQGIISGNSAYDTHIKTLNGISTFTSDTFTAQLTTDRSHLDSQIYSYDLMNTTLTPGVRKLPSALDLQILKAIWSETDPTNQVQGDRVLRAPLNTPPLIGINDGDFSQSALPNWDSRGSTTIINGEALLQEASPLLDNFSQTFVIPTGAKTLQFTLTGIDLDSSTLAPGDAFEAALLNAQTQQSLVGTATGITKTDAFLNLQHTGQVYAGSQVAITGNINNRINPAIPHTITIDLSTVQPGTLATLSFDLLGFGSKEGSIRLDDVRLFTDAQSAPIALNDNAQFPQAQPITLNILSNDSGTLNPATLQLGVLPTHGTIVPNLNGTVTYTPNPSYVGTDRFTYTIQDTIGALSNEATVTLTIANTAPTIANITTAPNITEGTSAQFSAIATDPGNDPLTYQWNFGDNSSPVNGQTLSHTYADNGNYTVMLTVTDSNNGSITQTIPLVVANVAPIVTAGSNQTRYPGETIAFNGSFTDPGILDTHTITWNFGDNTTATGTLTPTHTYTTPGAYPVTLTVTDKDGGTTTDTLSVTIRPQPRITISDETIAEDNGTALCTVSLSEASEQSITVNYTTANGTAIAGLDYTATTNTLTFAPGETTKAIAIPVLNDTLNEPNETFTVNLSNPVHATIADGQGLATILDNDRPATLIVSDRTFTEGDDGSLALTFTVNLSTPSGQVVTVNYATANGTALAGTDYTATSGILTFAPGETTQTLVIPVLGDRIDEANETFLLNFTNPTDATLATNQATATILDNDSPPAITIADQTVTETDSGTTTATFTISLSEASGQAITVDYMTNDGTAIAGADYTSTLGTITFVPGQTTQTIAIPISGDRLDEANETFFVTLTNPIHATIVDADAIGAILDNDNSSALTISNPTLTEGDNGSNQVIFTVNLTEVSGQPITVNYNTVDGTAIAGTDYLETTGTLTFAPGQITQTIMVPVLGDRLDEANETFAVALTNPTNVTLSNTQATATILDNDNPPNITINNTTITENENGTTQALLTISLSEVSGQTITVNYATANGTAIAGTDYTATTGTLTFAPGETTQTIAVSITDDLLNEANETFFVNLTNPTNATLGNSQATTTILDNDNLPALTISDIAVNETDSGTTSATFTISLSEISGQAITVNYAITDGTAIAGSDYTATTGVTTFAPGQTTQTITVPVIGDRLDEANETFLVNLSNPIHATLATPSATATIVDNDNPPAMTISDTTMTETDSGTTAVTFTVTLTESSGQPITVNYETTDVTAIAGVDYTATNGTLTFIPGQTTQTITVQVNGDRLDEANETFILSLTNPANVTLSRTQAIATLVDNDNPPVISVADQTVTETDSGTTVMTFTVSLSEASGQPITVDYTTTNGTAIAGADYTATSGTLTFAPGQTIQTVTVEVKGDLLLHEANEAFTLNLTSPSNATISRNQAIATIVDNDNPPALTIGNATVTESDSGTTAMTFTATLSEASGQPITVNYNTANGTALAGTDFAAANGTLTFAPGQITQTVTVQLIGDRLDEANETFVVNLSNPTNATIMNSQATATIVDNDNPPSVTIADRSVTESDDGSTQVVFTLTLSEASGQPKYRTKK